jgi:hypothetical protein
MSFIAFLQRNLSFASHSPSTLPFTVPDQSSSLRRIFFIRLMEFSPSQQDSVGDFNCGPRALAVRSGAEPESARVCEFPQNPIQAGGLIGVARAARPGVTFNQSASRK